MGASDAPHSFQAAAGGKLRHVAKDGWVRVILPVLQDPGPTGGPQLPDLALLSSLLEGEDAGTQVRGGGGCGLDKQRGQGGC